ncbi:MAG: S9 family peptidase, partial [Frateuria sp.]|nr:S9 family peptidase [Frateuria sp.]
MNRLVRAALCAATLLMPAIAAAADLLPVEDFARHPQLSMPRLSPDGKYLALRWDDGRQHALMIYRVEDMSKPVSMLRMPKYELPAGITWVSPTRLVVEKGKELGSIDRPAFTGEIIATDVDGKRQDYLYGYESMYGSRSETRGRDRGWGAVDDLPERANGHFYMRATRWENQDS